MGTTLFKKIIILSALTLSIVLGRFERANAMEAGEETGAAASASYRPTREAPEEYGLAAHLSLSLREEVRRFSIMREEARQKRSGVYVSRTMKEIEEEGKEEAKSAAALASCYPTFKSRTANWLKEGTIKLRIASWLKVGFIEKENNDECDANIAHNPSETLYCLWRECAKDFRDNHRRSDEVLVMSDEVLEKYVNAVITKEREGLEPEDKKKETFNVEEYRREIKSLGSRAVRKRQFDLARRHLTSLLTFDMSSLMGFHKVMKGLLQVASLTQKQNEVLEEADMKEKEDSAREIKRTIYSLTRYIAQGDSYSQEHPHSRSIWYSRSPTPELNALISKVFASSSLYTKFFMTDEMSFYQLDLTAKEEVYRKWVKGKSYKQILRNQYDDLCYSLNQVLREIAYPTSRVNISTEIGYPIIEEDDLPDSCVKVTNAVIIAADAADINFKILRKLLRIRPYLEMTDLVMGST